MTLLVITGVPSQSNVNSLPIPGKSMRTKGYRSRLSILSMTKTTVPKVTDRLIPIEGAATGIILLFDMLVLQYSVQVHPLLYYGIGRVSQVVKLANSLLYSSTINCTKATRLTFPAGMKFFKHVSYLLLGSPYVERSEKIRLVYKCLYSEDVLKRK